MRYQQQVGRRYLWFLVIIMNASISVFWQMPGTGLCFDFRPDNPQKGNLSAQKKDQASQAAEGNARGSKELAANRKEEAMMLFDNALANSHQVNPAEYSILIQVEAGTILWGFDKERSLTILKKAAKTLDEIQEEGKQSETRDPADYERRKRLRFLILRRIAALRPELIKRFLVENSSGNNSKAATEGEWTEEARAIISVASDNIEKDPKLAARLAEQSLDFGFFDWTSFLERLAQRDNGEAEQLAIVLINRLRDSYISSSALLNLKGFVFASNRSLSLQEHFLRSFLIRLRRDLRPDISVRELGSGLNNARSMSQVAAASYPQWQVEFDKLIQAFEAILRDRSLSIPGPPPRKLLSVSTMLEVEQGDAQEITSAIPRIGAITNPRDRDKQYQRLAARAGANADMVLAEEILSKIEDGEIRGQTSVMLYSPLVREAIAESNWAQAQKQAINMIEPLGRTLALDSIAQAMNRTVKDKTLIKDVYDLAMARLQREAPSDKVVKGFLILSRSLYQIDAERGLEAIKLSVWALNKLADKDDLLKESPAGSAVAAWVRTPNHLLQADEVLDLSDMVTTAFKDLAKRNADDALSVAAGLSHRGLCSLAQLAIAEYLLNSTNDARSVTQKRKKGR